MDNQRRQLVVFTLEEQRYALDLSVVRRVFRSVEITPLPKAPDIVLGVINAAGQIVPVVNVRKRFGLPQRDIGLSDQIIIATTARRTVGLLVDTSVGVTERDWIPAKSVLPSAEYVEGFVKLDPDLVLIHDLDRFLSLDEDDALTRALDENASE